MSPNNVQKLDLALRLNNHGVAMLHLHRDDAAVTAFVESLRILNDIAMQNMPTMTDNSVNGNANNGGNEEEPIAVYIGMEEMSFAPPSSLQEPTTSDYDALPRAAVLDLVSLSNRGSISNSTMITCLAAVTVNSALPYHRAAANGDPRLVNLLRNALLIYTSSSQLLSTCAETTVTKTALNLIAMNNAAQVVSIQESLYAEDDGDGSQNRFRHLAHFLRSSSRECITEACDLLRINDRNAIWLNLFLASKSIHVNAAPAA